MAERRKILPWIIIVAPLLIWGIADNERFVSSMLVSVAIILSGVYVRKRAGFRKYSRIINE